MFDLRMEDLKMNYYDKEKRCQDAFDQALKEVGPFWHVYTPGSSQVCINETAEDFRFSVSNVAISAAEAGVVVVSFQVMGNHLHIILCGSKERCLLMLELYRYRMIKYLRSKGRLADLDAFRCDDPIPITTLDAVRNEIVYVNRNGYVADPNVTPFSYPWGSGMLYFNYLPLEPYGILANHLPYKEKRHLTFRSAFTFPNHYRYGDGMILPISFVNFELGQSFFRDAHHYISMLMKNQESYSELAKRMGDKAVVTDEEMFAVVRSLVRPECRDLSFSILPHSDKLSIAQKLHFDYKASNQQIRRLLKLDIALLNEMFPPKL